ncbi:sigma-70 family RNA polymerase sigma factor [Metasolibacillus meyeri]|uniref:Sigma-70 family RNA polymerase sigma factor n=1 Tax=Metasolibacillus meyeri TaxID=1071052 RepID=A0AAW9NTV8_9BACL|nr:sigma-70 family RNA polymerase sigma factor [Metasolibacillus meyeri]MEC1177955.1 sigma-70 family RNA polymerase sigma factor [Metasolibacillus meyeri]
MLLSEERAFRAIMESYSEYLLKIAYLYVKDWQIAEDIVQDVFLTYYQKFEQFEERSSLKTYLVRITINKCKDYLKSWKYRKLSLTNYFFGTKKDASPLIELEERLHIADAVLNLPIHLREVIIHYYYEELSVLEVAAVLSLSDNTVKTRLRRARQLLKKELTYEEWEVLSHE